MQKVTGSNPVVSIFFHVTPKLKTKSINIETKNQHTNRDTKKRKKSVNKETYCDYEYETNYKNIKPLFLNNLVPV